MTETAAPDLALEPYLLGQEAVLGLAAAVVCFVSLFVVAHPLSWAIAVTIGAVVGLAVGLPLVHWSRLRLYERVVSSSGTPQRPRQVALRLGAFRGLIALGVILIVELADKYVLGSDVLEVTGPLLVAFAVLQEFARRGLLSWESQQQERVCTRVGKSRFAWTRQGARSQLVRVPIDRRDLLSTTT